MNAYSLSYFSLLGPVGTIAQILVALFGLARAMLGTDGALVGTVFYLFETYGAVASRSFQVKVTGPCPTGIYSGMFGRVVIPLEEEKVLAIPRRAVREVGQLELVQVVENGRAPEPLADPDYTKVFVTRKAADHDGIDQIVQTAVRLDEVLAGLSGDDVRLRDGVRAAVRAN